MLARLIYLLIFLFTSQPLIAAPLSSWQDGATKKTIVDFVTAVTQQGGAEYVQPAKRIAVFDNDGTLWAEQPAYFQLLFAIDRVKALAPQHPEWNRTQPFQAVLEGDMKTLLASGEKGLLQLVMATHTGMTTDEFEQVAKEWIATARHPTSGKPYTEMVYLPMLELLEYLRGNGFKTYIVSGGGIEFMRPWTEAIYGIPPEQVIGSTVKTKFVLRDGAPVLERLPEFDFINDKQDKPIAINRTIGRRPIAAFGNSDGDLQMLQWATSGNGRRLGVIIHHTDARREWAYDRDSHIGRLDKALGLAGKNGWVVVDMQRDWLQIFR